MARSKPNLWHLGARLAAAGPVFTKELRVDSRRLRQYLFRAGYVALLTVFVALAWTLAVESEGGSAAYRVSRMAEVGKTIVATIAWFQFFAVPLAAVILLSTSVSGEIRRRTLAVLMTTPLSPFQIVSGKLLSSLLPLSLVLAASLPLMAVVRVFGGVPWDFVASSLAVTFTAALFAGAAAIFFSILFRQAYAAILLTLASEFVLYFVLPSVLSLVLLIVSLAGGGAVGSVMIHLHPLAAMFACTGMLFSPGMGGLTFLWPAHCLFMLILTGIVLWLDAILFRRVAMKRAMSEGEASADRSTVPPRFYTRSPVLPPRPGSLSPPEAGGFPHGASPAPAVPPPPPAGRTVPAAACRPVGEIGGSPLLWREVRAKLFPSLVTRVAVWVIFGTILVATYLVNILAGGFVYGETHVVYAFVYVLAALLGVSVLSATCIASEKESRCLPILLTTPLTDRHVIFAKAVGVVRRVLPFWAILMGHVAVFTMFRLIHPLALAHVLMLVVGTTAFLTGSGLYFGAVFRRASTAAMLNIALGAALWILVPFVLSLAHPLPGSPALDLLSANPMAQVGAVMDGAAGHENARCSVSHLRYSWPDGGSYRERAGLTTLRMLGYAVLYGGAGLLLAWRASHRLRRHLF